MKLSPKSLVSVCTLGLALAVSSRAAEEPATLQVPIPAAPEASESAPMRKGKADRPGRGAMVDDLKEMQAQLNLTADQEKKIANIRRGHLEDLKAARGDRAQMAEVLKQQRSEVRAVLNPDQQKQFDGMTADALGKAKGKGKGKARNKNEP